MPSSQCSTTAGTTLSRGHSQEALSLPEELGNPSKECRGECSLHGGVAANSRGEDSPRTSGCDLGQEEQQQPRAEGRAAKSPRKGVHTPPGDPTEHAQCELMSAPPHVSSPGCRARGASARKEGALLTSPAPPLRLPCSAPASLPSRGWRLCGSELITARKPSV